MKCINRAEKEAEILCTDCNKPFCPECTIEVAGENFCHPCLEKRVTLNNECVNDEPVSQPGNKSKFWAFILSLIPGVGYMYLGLMRRGLEVMTLFFGTIFVSS